MLIDFHIFPIAFTLFLLMDSLGNIPLFIAILKDFPPKKQRQIILRELTFALAIIVAFYFLGNLLLDLIHVKQHTILMAGGIILFLIAIRMVFPEFFYSKPKKASSHKEPFIVPLAIPLVAGPAVLASIMLYSKEGAPHSTVLSALFLAWIASSIILLSSSLLQKVLGERGLTACERLMGLLLTLISVQMFLQGVSLYVFDINKPLP
ncbi:MAG: MarC family protein [Chlamydiota bacterium]